jgi:hypothetical protein
MEEAPAEAPVAEAPVEPPMAEPVPEPMPAPEPVAEAAPAEAPAEEESTSIPGWFRLDSDALNLQAWVGATYPLTDSLGLATDIYMDSADFGEFDIGLEIAAGENVLLIPMVGVGFNWQQQRATMLIAPQLFAYLDFDPLYIEYWGQAFMGSVFASDAHHPNGDEDTEKDLAADYFYNRLFVLFNATDNLAAGLQIEPSIALNDNAKIPDENGEPDKALFSMPVGGRLNLGYGENNTAGLFLGYETVEEARSYDILDEDGNPATTSRGIVGRFTFIRTW